MTQTRGHSNGNERGSAKDRRRRREWLLLTFGDGQTCPCTHCNKTLTDATITVDRIVPGVAGGRYVRSNIQPSCMECNISAYRPWHRFLAEFEPEDLEAISDAELAAAYAAWAS